MKYLVDTNIFLEILLGDSRSRDCESFIREHHGDLYISDFSINSIGIITHRLKQLHLFDTFLRDILPHIHIARLAEYSYQEIVSIITTKGLDFDDAYQYVAAKEYNLSIATLDRDFKKIETEHPIILL